MSLFRISMYCISLGKDESGGILPGPPLVKQLRQRVYGQILGFDFDVIDTRYDVIDEICHTSFGPIN